MLRTIISDCESYNSNFSSTELMDAHGCNVCAIKMLPILGRPTWM